MMCVSQCWRLVKEDTKIFWKMFLLVLLLFHTNIYCDAFVRTSCTQGNSCTILYQNVTHFGRNNLRWEWKIRHQNHLRKDKHLDSYRVEVYSKEIYIGGLFEMSGTRGSSGSSELTATRLAVADINSKNALPGYTLKLLSNTTQVGFSAMYRLLLNKATERTDEDCQFKFIYNIFGVRVCVFRDR